jgi:hypothetical protein
VLRHWPTRPRPATHRVRRLTAMAGGQFRQPNDPNGPTGFGRALSSVKRPNPLVIAWRWRYELALALGLAGSTFGIIQAYGVIWLVAALMAVTAAFGLWPPGRRLLVTRAWCVITPHRLRTGCANAWIHSRYGRLPIILLTTAQPFGERVLLWCVAGVSAEDLISAREALIAACWAADIKVIRSGRHRQLVIVDVIRRPPDGPASPEADRLSWPG